jgi:prevent-host-death family protein
MYTVDLHHAKIHLSQLVDDVAAGSEVIIAKAGKPMARLVPLGAARRKIRFGLLKGRIRIARDFDSPLQDADLTTCGGG